MTKQQQATAEKFLADAQAEVAAAKEHCNNAALHFQRGEMEYAANEIARANAATAASQISSARAWLSVQGVF